MTFMVFQNTLNASVTNTRASFLELNEELTAI